MTPEGEHQPRSWPRPAAPEQKDSGVTPGHDIVVDWGMGRVVHLGTLSIDAGVSGFATWQLTYQDRRRTRRRCELRAVRPARVPAARGADHGRRGGHPGRLVEAQESANRSPRAC